MVAILHAAANYHRNLNGHSADLEGKADRLHAFVGVMRSAGLSILETTILARTRLADDDRLEVYHRKTGEPVYLPLEPELATELRGIDRCLHFFEIDCCPIIRPTGNPVRRDISFSQARSSSVSRMLSTGLI
jgi:hypothetical protein